MTQPAVEIGLVPDDRYPNQFAAIHCMPTAWRRRERNEEIGVGKFPQSMSGAEQSDIDLDEEEFVFQGERLTEARGPANTKNSARRPIWCQVASRCRVVERTRR